VREDIMITIDSQAGVVTVEDGGRTRTLRMDEPEAFRVVSEAWLRVGWATKHVYSFTWLGRPVIQLPEDLLRVQEVVFSVKPDVIIETGVAHGGGLIFYASLCRLAGRGRVVGIDLEIRPQNRAAIRTHPLADASRSARRRSSSTRATSRRPSRTVRAAI
jgi:cephalosporin hydroxylase